MKRYFLLHENKRLALFKVGDFNNIVDIEFSKNINTLKFLPFGVRDKATLRLWLANRGIHITRQGLNLN